MVKNIRNIFIDLFGVLIGADSSAVTHYVATVTNNPYYLAHDILYGDRIIKLERHELNFRQYFTDIQYALKDGEKLQYEPFKARWDRIGLSELPPTGLLSKMNKKYKLFILSNASNHTIRHLKSKFSFFEYINGIITSEDAGMMKPHSGIYKYAMYKFGAVPDQSVMIDDSPGNVKAAEYLGMTGHCYTNFENFERFISGLNS